MCILSTFSELNGWFVPLISTLAGSPLVDVTREFITDDTFPLTDTALMAPSPGFDGLCEHIYSVVVSVKVRLRIGFVIARQAPWAQPCLAICQWIKEDGKIKSIYIFEKDGCECPSVRGCHVKITQLDCAEMELLIFGCLYQGDVSHFTIIINGRVCSSSWLGRWW